MTNEEAIRYFKRHIDLYCVDGISREAEEMAIKALEQQPSDTVSRGAFEQVMWERDVAIGQLKELGYGLGQKVELCEDAISRQAALKELRESAEHHANDSREEVLLRRDRDIIRALPPVTPQQKYGKWIAQQEVNGDDYFKAYDISGVMTYAAKYKCDKCGFIQFCIEDHGRYKYCPNCGCRMVEPQESEDE